MTFAFDCHGREIVEIHAATLPMALAFEETPSDRHLHTEFLHSARPRQTNLVTELAIAARYPKLRTSLMQHTCSGERQDKAWSVTHVTWIGDYAKLFCQGCNRGACSPENRNGHRRNRVERQHHFKESSIIGTALTIDCHAELIAAR
jgi:hypothetical protein